MSKYLKDRMQRLNNIHKEWNDAAYQLIHANEALKTNARTWKCVWACNGMAGICLAIAGPVWYVCAYAAVATFVTLHTVSEKHRLIGIYNKLHRSMKIADERFTKQVIVCKNEWYKLVESEEFAQMEKMSCISNIFLKTLRREGIIRYKDKEHG